MGCVPTTDWADIALRVQRITGEPVARKRGYLINVFHGWAINKPIFSAIEKALEERAGEKSDLQKT